MINARAERLEGDVEEQLDQVDDAVEGSDRRELAELRARTARKPAPET